MVLILDDDERVTEYIGLVLEGLGAQYCRFHSADAAMERYKAGGIRAVVMDVHLPGNASGLDIAKAMRRTQPHLPILFVTGLGDPQNVALLRQHGDYLQKEFFFDTAQERLAQLVARIHT